MSQPTHDIHRRWDASAEQVARSAAAIRQRQLSLANTSAEIDLRLARLRAQRVDLEAIVDKDDSVWLSFLSRGLRVARAVGRIGQARPGQPVDAIGTGVLVSERLILTNNHVIRDPEEAAGTCVQLGYEFDDEGAERTFDTTRIDPESGFFTDEELDFTLAAVFDIDGVAPGKKHGYVTLIERLGKVLRAERLNVIHHPGGHRKRISIRENRMVAEDDLWLRYTSDTERGSSGAPVFNDQWEMVALHHGAVPRLNYAGTRLTRTGVTMAEENTTPRYIANEGARVSRIVQRLRAAQLDGPTAALVQQALAEWGDQ